MILRITENAERDQTVQHRRINCCQSVAALADSLEHPTLGFLERALSRGTEAKLMQDFQNVIETKKEIAPGPKTLAPRQTQIALLGADRIKFVKLFIPG